MRGILINQAKQEFIHSYQSNDTILNFEEKTISPPMSKATSWSNFPYLVKSKNESQNLYNWSENDAH